MCLRVPFWLSLWCVCALWSFNAGALAEYPSDVLLLLLDLPFVY